MEDTLVEKLRFFLGKMVAGIDQETPSPNLNNKGSCLVVGYWGVLGSFDEFP